MCSLKKRFIGAHVSIAGGVENAPLNAAAINASGFAMFTKNQRQWKSAPLSAQSIENFKKNCREYNFPAESILPHDGYLINLGQFDDDKLKQSRAAFLDEMQRCMQLGLKYLNFHPGSHLNELPIDDCLRRIAQSVNLALAESENVIAVIENTAGQGSNVGYSFEQLARLIELIGDDRRVGVCLDTCHTFAAGYDLRDDYDGVMNRFNELVGFDKLCGMHLNDAKAGLNSHLDRHESLGAGTLGKEVFARIMSDERIGSIPMILETVNPELWPQEIEFLKSI